MINGYLRPNNLLIPGSMTFYDSPALFQELPYYLAFLNIDEMIYVVSCTYVRDENASAGGKWSRKLDEKRWYGVLKRW